ncbi:nascent polypeptide-associated complex protein [Candidatus Woesearchaeota archaeon]|nr:nascent polypeptide-associated complex protein [Candidatus Woesearchaeota archaeon]MBW3014292.1 nascent polypeptide-associated complex protein [Candidatus Woesearchaeota archaeon]
MNPRKMQKMMSKMGIQSSDIDAEYVIIRTATEELVFDSPQVSKVNMMGQETYQIVGTPVVREIEEESLHISPEDIETIRSQTGVSEEEAREALSKAGGDLAKAIINIKEKNSQ